MPKFLIEANAVGFVMALVEADNVEEALEKIRSGKVDIDPDDDDDDDDDDDSSGEEILGSIKMVGFANRYAVLASEEHRKIFEDVFGKVE